LTQSQARVPILSIEEERVGAGSRNLDVPCSDAHNYTEVPLVTSIATIPPSSSASSQVLNGATSGLNSITDVQVSLMSHSATQAAGLSLGTNVNRYQVITCVL
jgi:hypothetical protein